MGITNFVTVLMGFAIMYFITKLFSRSKNKLEYSYDLQNRVETYGVEIGDRLDLVLVPDSFEIQIYPKGVTEDYGKLAILIDEEMYGKVKTGKAYAQVTSITMGSMKIEFFE